MSWPPELDDLKIDLKIDLDDTRDDEVLTRQLDAAVAFVQKVRPQFNYDGDALDDRPVPTADHVLGTVRLAGRWFARRRSPDALVAMGDLGSARVPSFDPDIEKLLRIGRYAKAVIG